MGTAVRSFAGLLLAAAFAGCGQGVEVKLEPSATVAHAGDRVWLTVKARNLADEPLQVGRCANQLFWATATDGARERIIGFETSCLTAQEPRLAPGERTFLHLDWVPDEPGRWQVRGVFDGTESEAVTIEVLPAPEMPEPRVAPRTEALEG